jgi:hypothetical protein
MTDRDRRDPSRDGSGAGPAGDGDAVARWVAAVVERAPPLTAAQVDELRGFLPRPRREGASGDAA